MDLTHERDNKTGMRVAGAPWPMDAAATFLAVSRRTLDRAAKDGSLRTIRLGRRRLIADEEVRRLATRGLCAAECLSE